MKRFLKQEQGAAMIVALLVMAVVLMLGTAMMVSAQDSVVRTVWDSNSSKAFHAAEAGFDEAMYRARNSLLQPGTITGTTKEAEYQVTVTGMTGGGAGEFLFEIKSVGAAPSFSKPKAKRAVSSRLAALSPYSMFFASVSAGDIIEGNATIDGAFYTRDFFGLSGTGGSAGKFTGGPLFIKDIAGTPTPTGDLSVQGNAQIGTPADPIYLFVDGKITGQTSNIYSKGTYSDVPDLSFPLVTIDDIVNNYRPAADEVIDSDVTKTGTTDLILNRSVPAGGYTSPGGHLKYQWLNGARTQALLTVDGTVYIDGDVLIGSKTGVAVTTYFQGTGTIVAYGEVNIESSFLPYDGFPTPSIVGFITADETEVEGKPGDVVYGVIYSSSELKFEGQIQYHGAALSQQLEFENNPKLVLEPEVALNLPPNMPNPESQVSVSGWTETKP